VENFQPALAGAQKPSGQRFTYPTSLFWRNEEGPSTGSEVAHPLTSSRQFQLGQTILLAQRCLCGAGLVSHLVPEAWVAKGRREKIRQGRLSIFLRPWLHAPSIILANSCKAGRSIKSREAIREKVSGL